MNFMNMMNMVSGLYPWARMVCLWICHLGDWTGAAPALKTPSAFPKCLHGAYRLKTYRTRQRPNILFYLVGPHGLEPWTKGL